MNQGFYMTKHLYHRSFFSTVFATATLLVLTGCQAVSPSNSNNHDHKTITQTQDSLSPVVQTVVGDYASSGYDKRQQGYDWVGVIVRPNTEVADMEDIDIEDSDIKSIDIKVRARSDIKKPSCHFDGKANLIGQDDAHGIIFQSKFNDSTAFFQFKDDKLTIDSEDKYALNYFCSGGATIVGEYQNLAGELELN